MVSSVGSYNATAPQTGSWVMQVATFKAAAAIVTPPSVPTGLKVTGTSNFTVSLSWTASTDSAAAVAGYDIYRNGVQVGVSSTTSYQDTGLVAATTYTYTVAAYDASGNTSAQSSSVSATTLASTTPPTVPSGVVVSNATSESLTVTWTASTDSAGVTGYHVYRNGTLLATVTGTIYLDTALTSNTTYAYTVSAFDAAGNVSAQSAAVSGTTLATSTFPFATAVSANYRYLLDQNGNPFMIVGDSPHTLSTYDTTAEMSTYFATRHAQGFNSALVQLIVGPYIDSTGIIPDAANFATYDGITPFTVAGNISTPNPAYFSRMVTMAQEAESNGITLFLDPADTGSLLDSSSFLVNNGATADYNYGVFLGNTFKNFQNIVWDSGNDYADWGPTNDAYVLGIAEEIRSVAPNQLQTVELLSDEEGSSASTPNLSSDDPEWATFENIDGVYTYYSPYSTVLQGYNFSAPTQPVIGQEYNYEYEDNTGNTCDTGSTVNLRHQEYWTMTSGAAGQLYGNHYTWDATSWAQEQSYLNSPGAQQMTYMAEFFNSIPWYDLVPDQGHSFVSGDFEGQNQGAECDDTTVTSTLTPNGTTGVVYVPESATITVNLSLMSGAVTARWFDPSDGTYVAVNGSPYAASSGDVQFTTPGLNSNGNGDWVLLLTGNGVPDTTAPSVPTGLKVTSATSSTVGLSWTASTDNVAVAGYDIYRNGNLVGSTTNTTYTDSGLNANTTYSYTVSAYDSADNMSAQSAAVSATTTSAPSKPATPTFVQLNTATPQTSESTATVSYGKSQTSGDTNIVVIGFYDTNATISSVTDSAGNVYALAAPLTSSGPIYQAIYYAKNIKLVSFGSNTVKVTFSTAVQYPDIRIVEYSGLDQTSPLNAVASGTGTGGTANSGNVSTAEPSELLFAAGTTVGAFSAAGTGYTLRVITSPDADIVEDRDVTSIGTYGATASDSGDYVVQLVAFVAAGQ